MQWGAKTGVFSYAKSSTQDSFRDPALIAFSSLLYKGATCHCCSRHP
jgi:hypothetical protein